MPPELRDLLERSVAHPPAEPHAVHDVVRRAAASRRRRRATVAGTAVTTVLVVVAGAALVGRGLGGDAPVVDDTVHGPVVHPEDATHARSGTDYQVRQTYLNRDLDQRNGRTQPRVDAAGEVLVQQSVWRDPTDPFSEYLRFGVVGPDTGTVTWLPAPPGATYAHDHAPSGPQVADLTPTHVLWTDEPVHRGLPYHLYDRTDGSWTDGTLQKGPREMDVPTARVAAGRIWYSGGLGAQRTTLWSIPVDGSAAPRREATVGDWAVDDQQLVWTRWTNRPNDSMTVRDLATGRQHSVDPLSGDHCNQLGMALSGDRVALTQYCGTRRHVRDDRVQVVSTSGDQLVTVQGDGVELGGLGTSFVVVTDYSGRPGTLVYDFTVGRLLRLSDSLGRYSDAVGAGGSTLTWNTAVNHHKGMRLWTATWRD